MVAVLRTIVSPWRTTTAPEACRAILPVSNEISLPAISTETVVTASLLICAAFPGPPVGRRADSSCFSYSERDHGIEQVRIVRSDPHGRRRRRPGAQRVVDVAPDALGDRVAAAVALEAVEVDAERARSGPTGAGPRGGPGRRTARRASSQNAALVRRPPRSRARARPRAGASPSARSGGRRRGRAPASAAGRRPRTSGRRSRRRTGPAGVVGPADVVVRARAGDLGAAQVGHPLKRTDVARIAMCRDPCPAARAAAGRAARGRLPVLRRPAEPRGDHAAAAAVPAADARAESRWAPGRSCSTRCGSTACRCGGTR